MSGPLLCLGLALSLSIGNNLFRFAYPRRPHYLNPLGALGDNSALRSRPLIVALGFVAFACIGGVVFGGAPVLFGLPLLAVMALFRRWDSQEYDDALRLGRYLPAAGCLIGLLLGSETATLLGASPADAWARGWDVSAGIFGGSYVLAGIAKVQETGWHWGRAEYMSLMLAERGFGRLGPLRLWAAQSRPLCALIGFTGMAVELGAAGMVFAPLRPALAVVVALFKGLTQVLFGYFEPEWVLVAVAIGWAAL